MKGKEFYLISALSIMGILFTATIIHETTHIVMGQGAKGICFGNCAGAMARVWINSAAGANEMIPSILGMIVSAILAVLLFTSKMFKERINAAN